MMFLQAHRLLSLLDVLRYRINSASDRREGSPVGGYPQPIVEAHPEPLGVVQNGEVANSRSSELNYIAADPACLGSATVAMPSDSIEATQRTTQYSSTGLPKLGPRQAQPTLDPEAHVGCGRSAGKPAQDGSVGGCRGLVRNHGSTSNNVTTRSHSRGAAARSFRYRSVLVKGGSTPLCLLASLTWMAPRWCLVMNRRTFTVSGKPRHPGVQLLRMTSRYSNKRDERTREDRPERLCVSQRRSWRMK